MRRSTSARLHPGRSPYPLYALSNIGSLATYRVGGPAARFAVVEGEADLRRVADAVAASGVEVLVVGKGANLLVAAMQQVAALEGADRLRNCSARENHGVSGPSGDSQQITRRVREGVF